MKRLDYYISYRCDSNCEFCCSRSQMERYGRRPDTVFVPVSEIEEYLLRRRGDRAGYVTFTGGEPTLHPEFTHIVRIAKQLGMHVSVLTNMTRFADPEFCRETFPWIDEINASIHGHTAKLHNRITGSQRAWHNFEAAVENIHSINSNIEFVTCTVMCKTNLEYLPEIAEMLAGVQKLRQAHFSTVGLAPGDEQMLAHLVPTLPEIEPHLPAIVDNIAVRAGKILRFYGVPFCTLKDYIAYSNDLYYSEHKMVRKLTRTIVGTPDSKKRKIEKCRVCAHSNICLGCFNSYYKIYGDTHLGPVLNKKNRSK